MKDDGFYQPFMKFSVFPPGLPRIKDVREAVTADLTSIESPAVVLPLYPLIDSTLRTKDCSVRCVVVTIDDARDEQVHRTRKCVIEVSSDLLRSF